MFGKVLLTGDWNSRVRNGDRTGEIIFSVTVLYTV